jgi:hypothetical protein
MQFAGEFETHLTIEPRSARDVHSLRAWAVEHRLKYVHIILARGQTASQPMLTRHGRGTLSTELEIASALSHQLSLAGFIVSRIKLEVPPHNPDVPQHDADDAAAQPPDRYFEHHVKLLLNDDANTHAICNLAQRHGAHLSRNAFRVRADASQERFITQRCHQVGRPTARRNLEALLADLSKLNCPVIEVEQEFVVYDSNLAVDAGWINT